MYVHLLVVVCVVCVGSSGGGADTDGPRGREHLDADVMGQSTAVRGSGLTMWGVVGTGGMCACVCC